MATTIGVRWSSLVAGLLLHQMLGAQAIQVFDAGGNLVSTHPVVAPYLHTAGSVLFQRPDNTNLYATRVPGSLAWRLCDPALPPATTPPASTLPGYLELDGKWYRLTTGAIQAFFAPNNHFVVATASSCTAAGAPLGVAVAPKITLSGVEISLSPTTEILLENLPNADVIRLRSRSGNIECVGQVASPVLAEAIFANGFQDMSQ